MAVDGVTITDTQISAVSDFETSEVATQDAIASAAIAEIVAQNAIADAAETASAAATGWVNICAFAIDGNPKDRSKVASRYNDLVDSNLITPVD